MKNFILSAGNLGGLLIACVVFGLIEIAGNVIYKDNSKAAVGVSCFGKSVDMKADHVVYALDCGGKEVETTDANTIAQLIKHPKARLTCTVYKSDKAEC